MRLLCPRFARPLVSKEVRSWSGWLVGKFCLGTRLLTLGDHFKLDIGWEGRRGSHRASLAEIPRMVSQPVQGSLSRNLWEGCRKQAMLALYNPFVVALAAGKLEKASFQSYISQDVFFLAAFSTAYGMALKNTDDPDAGISILSLQRAVDKELGMHSSYMQAWELSVSASQIVPNAATSTYTDFLLKTAAGQIPGFVEEAGESLVVGSFTFGMNSKLAAFTIAAMAPCMCLYAFLGRQLKGYALDNVYQSWIDTYSSDDFQNSALQIEQLLDKLASVCRDKDYKIIETLYNRAMDLEVAFFNAQPISESLLRAPFLKPRTTNSAAEHQVTIISDFDSTCSVADSCPALADLTISTEQEVEQEGGVQLSISSSDLRRKWDSLTKLYVEEYSDLLDKVLATRQGFEMHYDFKAIRSALSTMSEFEVQANQRVVDSGVLKGVELEKVRNTGRGMALRPGCQTFLERVRGEARVALYILSVCWSQSFVEGGLREGTDPVNIYCNELQVKKGVTDGNILRHVEHALDKEKVFDQIMHEATASNKHSVVYLGDSVTDLLCLIKADLGIVLGDSSTLQRFSAAFGVDIQPLFTAALTREENLGSKKTIYKALDWHEVQTFLLGD